MTEIIRRLENKVDSKFDELKNDFNSKFDELKNDFNSKFNNFNSKFDELENNFNSKFDKLENNRCFTFPNFCSWSRYVLPLHVFRLSEFDIGFGPPISQNASILPLRVKSKNSQQLNPVSEVEGDVEPVPRITSNARNR